MGGDRVIRLYRSNRTELLADQLAQLLAAPVAGPLDAEWVVVQGRGMAVWLAMQLARRHGVCAGLELVYPANLVRRLVEGLGTDRAERAQAWDGERLTWSLMSALGAVDDDAALAPLSGYLAGDEACRRRYALATRLADLLDHYTVYRSEMIRAWDRGEDEVAVRHGEAWQPVLWRRLVATLGDGHAAALEQELLSALASGTDRVVEGLVTRLPPRIAVFGLVSLPPMYLRVLAALSHHTEVHWFMPSPAVGYWADLVSKRTVARVRVRGAAPESIHLEEGHPLLVSCGRLAADTLDVMTQELEVMGIGEREPAGDLHRPSGVDSVLGRLQDDILEGRAGAHAGRPSDRSITIHACHGPMREVEVLHDQLLARLHGDDAIRPDEIVVMMADVDAYAPLVEAVFTRERDDDRFIPFSIADRAPRQDSPVVDAFQRVLALIGGRAKLSELLDLLALDPVGRRFGVTPSALDRLREWLGASGVRWGIDAAHRADHDQPPVHENTWRFGLERLLLGYAMPTGGRALFADRLPYDEVEGQDAVLLGRAVAFAERTFAVVRDLAAPRPVAAWRTDLLRVLDDLVAAPPEQAWQMQEIREAIAGMADAAASAGFDEPVGAEVIRRLVDRYLDDRGPARGFLRGGVTFC
ncbi:MAG TPA: exodeoxyribonuclease V subunit gamma, partial [Polyangiaceae bacterium]|nr:exodeoxyribonuclease V subunit gamma [Polyangiaceae bacterium]